MMTVDWRAVLCSAIVAACLTVGAIEAAEVFQGGGLLSAVLSFLGFFFFVLFLVGSNL